MPAKIMTIPASLAAVSLLDIAGALAASVADLGLPTLLVSADREMVHYREAGGEAARPNLDCLSLSGAALAPALLEYSLKYRLIIIACPMSEPGWAIDALCASDSVLIPFDVQEFSMEALALILVTITMVRRSSNPDLTIEGVFITGYDSRFTQSRRSLDELIRAFPGKVFKTRIGREHFPLPRRSSMARCPAVPYAALPLYMSLARELLPEMLVS
jgi:cellulose biosynthesis protein BcsQ